MRARDWVLVTDGTGGQNRSALAAVRALASAGYRAAVTVSGDRSIAAASRYCDRVVPVPPVDSPGYADVIRAETAARPYATVLPASDAAMWALEAPGRHLIDKAQLGALAQEAGLEVPPARAFEDSGSLRAAADDVCYPCVVKPVVRTSRRHGPARRFDTPEQLRGATHPPDALLVQPVVDGGMHAVVGVMWGGKLRAVAHQEHVRIWPRQCGDACCAVTTAPDPLLEKGLQLLLGDHDGIFQAEFCGPYLLDVNPRVYGSLPLAVSAGANPVGVFCDLLRGVDVPFVRGRLGVEYRWWEGELRHLAARWRSREVGIGRAARALRPRHGLTRNSLTPLSDPGPALRRLGYAGHALGSRLAGTPRGAVLARSRPEVSPPQRAGSRKG